MADQTEKTPVDDYKVEHIDSVDYGYSPEKAQYFGIHEDPARTFLNYKNIAKHYILANNMDALKDMVECAEPETSEAQIKTAAKKGKGKGKAKKDETPAVTDTPAAAPAKGHFDEWDDANAEEPAVVPPEAPTVTNEPATPAAAPAVATQPAAPTSFKNVKVNSPLKPHSDPAVNKAVEMLNQGHTWSSVVKALPDAVQALEVSPRVRDLVVAATSARLIEKPDTLEHISDVIPRHWMHQVLSDPKVKAALQEAADASKLPSPENTEDEEVEKDETSVTPENKEHALQEADEAMDPDIEAIVQQDPAKTRKFRDLLSKETKERQTNSGSSFFGDAGSSIMLLGHMLGIGKAPTKGAKGEEAGMARHPIHDTHVEELIEASLKDQDDPEVIAADRSALSKVSEGVNRSLNILTRHKAYTPALKGYDPVTMLNEFAEWLGTSSGMTNMLEVYRRSMNHRGLFEDEAPEKRAKPINTRYVWVGVPHYDPTMNDEGNKEAKELKEEFRKFMQRNETNPNPRDIIRIQVVEASWIKGARPVGMDSNVAAVISMSGKRYFDFNAHRTGREAISTQGTVKKAHELSEAMNFRTSHNITKQNLIGQSKDDLRNFIAKWFSLNALKGNIKSFIVPVEIVGKLTQIHNNPTERKKFEEWTKSNDAPLDDVSLMDDLKKTLGVMADKYASLLYNYLNTSTVYRGAEKATEVAAELWTALPVIMERILVEHDIPKNVKEWIDESLSATEQPESLRSMVDKFTALYNGYASLAEDFTIPGPGVKLTPEQQSDNDDVISRVESLVHQVGEMLVKDRRHDTGDRIISNSKEFSEHLMEKIIKPGVLNNASTRQISVFLIKGLESIIGNKPYRTPFMKTTEAAKVDENAKSDGKSPFEYLVYVAGDWMGRGNLRNDIVLQPGKVYDLIYGDYSEFDARDTVEAAKRKKLKAKDPNKPAEEERTHGQYEGFVLQVKDGHPVIQHEDRVLSTNEIPKFLEFATKAFITERGPNWQMPEKASEVADDEGHIISYTDQMAHDLHDAEKGQKIDSIFANQLKRQISGMNRTQIAAYLEKLDRQRNGLLAKSFKESYGSKVHVMPSGDIAVAPSKVQKALVERKGAPFHDKTTQVRGDILEELSQKNDSLPSIKDIDLSSINDPLKIVEAISKTKEVSAEFLKRILTMDFPINNNTHSHVYAAQFDDAIKAAMKNNGLGHYLTKKYDSSTKKKEFTGDAKRSRINDIVIETNSKMKKSGNPAVVSSYLKEWERAKNKWDSTQPDVNFDKMFMLDTTPTLRKGTVQVKDADATTFLKRVGFEIPEAAKDDAFRRVMEYVPVDGSFKVKDTDEDGNPIVMGDKVQLSNYILRTYTDKVKDLLASDPDLQKLIVEKDSSAPMFIVRPDASPDDLMSFIKENEADGEIGQMLKDLGGGAVSLKHLQSGVSNYSVVKPKSDEVVSGTKDWDREIDRGMNSLLTSFRNHIKVNKHVGELLNDGKAVEGMLARIQDYEGRRMGLEDLTTLLRNVFKEANRDLARRKKIQDYASMEKKLTQGEGATKKIVDYSDSAYRVKDKKKTLVRWLRNFSMTKQEEILSSIKTMLKNSETQPILDEVLSIPENIEVMKQIEDLEPTRPRTFGIRKFDK